MKVIIKYPPIDSGEVKIYDVEDNLEAHDLCDEASQQFGQSIILTNEEFKNLVNQNKDNEI